MLEKVVRVAALCLGAASVVAGCAFPVASASPRTLAEDTKEIVQDVTADEENIFSVLTNNFDEVNQLQAEVNANADDNADDSVMLDQVVTQLDKIAQSFERMANQREKTKKELMAKVEVLPKLASQAGGEIEALKTRRTELEGKLSDTEEVGGIPEGQRAREVAIQQAITYVDSQISIWEQFTRTQAAIQDQLDAVIQRIEAFMDIFDGNAILYREAVNLLKLQRDTKEALRVVTEGIPEIERLSKEMQDSWETLNSLVDALLTYTPQSAP